MLEMHVDCTCNHLTRHARERNARATYMNSPRVPRVEEAHVPAPHMPHVHATCCRYMPRAWELSAQETYIEHNANEQMRIQIWGKSDLCIYKPGPVIQCISNLHGSWVERLSSKQMQ